MNLDKNDSLEIEIRIKGFSSKELSGLPKNVPFHVEHDVLILQPQDNFVNYYEYETNCFELIESVNALFADPIDMEIVYRVFYPGDLYSLSILRPKLFRIMDEKKIRLKMIHKNI